MNLFATEVVIMHVISYTKAWRFNHTHKEDHTSKSIQAAGRERGSEKNEGRGGDRDLIREKWSRGGRESLE